MASQRSIVFIAAGYAMVFLSLMIIVVAQDEAQSASDQWALSSDDDQSKANSWIIQPVKRPNIPIPPGGMLLWVSFFPPLTQFSTEKVNYFYNNNWNWPILG